MIRAPRGRGTSVHVLLACSASNSDFIVAYQWGSLTAERTLRGTGEIGSVATRAYFGLGLWIPALALVTIGCAGCAGGGDTGGVDGAEVLVEDGEAEAAGVEVDTGDVALRPDEETQLGADGDVAGCAGCPDCGFYGGGVNSSMRRGGGATV